nr:MFS transporter [Microbulbifer sediminum]
MSLVPVIARECGLGPGAIGSLMGLGTMFLMVASPAWGHASDRYNRRPILLAGLYGILLAQVLFVALLVMLAEGIVAGTSALFLLGFSRALYGCCAAGIYPACQAWTVEYAGRGRELPALVSLSAAANLGRGLGPVLALAGLAVGGLWALGWLVLLPLFCLLAIPGDRESGRAPGSAAPAVHSGLPPLSLFAIALLGTTVIGQLQLALGPVLSDFYGLGVREAASATALLLVAAACCGFVVQSTLVNKLADSRTVLALGAVLLMAGAAIINAALGNRGALLGLFTLVAGTALLVPGYTALIAAHYHSGRGRQFGRLTALHTGGYTLGFVLGGWIYHWAPAAPLAGLLVGATLVASITLYALGRERRPPTGKTAPRPVE